MLPFVFHVKLPAAKLVDENDISSPRFSVSPIFCVTDVKALTGEMVRPRRRSMVFDLNRLISPVSRLFSTPKSRHTFNVRVDSQPRLSFPLLLSISPGSV